MYPLLRFVPKNHLSHLVGRLADARLPPVLQRRLIRWYINRYGADVDEASQPVTAYPTLGAFFRRDLRPGLRPIADGVVSPVDGSLEQFGPIDTGKMLQAKGKWYTAAELIGDAALGAKFTHGYFFTFYLAPGDYHHIHSPVSGTVTEAVHVPGALWPVNAWSVSAIPNLFCINERITSIIESDAGLVAVVKVGATNVGSITTEYNQFVGNAALFNRSRTLAHERFNPPIPVVRGQRVGSFRMGSTVVVLFEQASTFSNSAVAPAGSES